MDGQSLDIKQDSVAVLRGIFPNIFSEDRVDLEKFKAVFGDNIDFSNERYTLNWAGKADAFRTLQERTTATLMPQPELSVNFAATENVFIEGENLEVLKVLQKAYYNKIKCIIIDPPYNTGNDSFIYPDRFKENLEDYEKRVGERDDDGYLMKEGLFRKNSRENGHYHSNWLSMMLPRLFLARNLLRDDGVIFVHIDDNEVHNLRLLMNEIFGEENFVAQLVWQSRQNKDNRNISGVSIDHEYIICYTKQSGQRIFRGTERKTEQYANPDNDPRGPWTSANMVGLATADARPNLHYDLIDPCTNVNYGCPAKGWRYDQKTMKKLINEARVLWPEKLDGRPRRKAFLNDLSDNLPGFSSIIKNGIYTNTATKEITQLLGGHRFDFPKPSMLLISLLLQCTELDDIVFDFFSGSATTAHAVMQLNIEDGGNRKFIMVQLPEPCDETSEAYKAGYKNISDISRERIRRVIQKMEKEQQDASAKNDMFGKDSPALDLGFKSYRLSPSNFKEWRGEEITEDNLAHQLEMFIDPVKPESKTENMLVELMLKSGYQLTDKAENRGHYYCVSGNELVIVLTKMDLDIAREISALQPTPQKVIALDRLFADNDELKTNTALQLQDAGVEFRTV